MELANKLPVQIQHLQKYRDDVAKELGRTHNPERIKRETEEDIEDVRRIFSSKGGQSMTDPDIPHRNYLPKIS